MARAKQLRRAKRSTGTRRRASPKASGVSQRSMKKRYHELLTTYPLGCLLYVWNQENVWYAIDLETEWQKLSDAVFLLGHTATQTMSGSGEQQISSELQKVASGFWSQTSRPAPPDGSSSPGET